MSAVTPRVQAMLLADNVYDDISTRKKIIAGTVNTFNSSQFPAVHPSVTLFVSLTNVFGSQSVEIRLVDLDDYEVVARMPPISVSGQDRLGTHEMIIRLTPFPLPHPGIMSLELHCDDVLLGSLRILVNESEPPKGETTE